MLHNFASRLKIIIIISPPYCKYTLGAAKVLKRNVPEKTAIVKLFKKRRIVCMMRHDWNHILKIRNWIRFIINKRIFLKTTLATHH